ncbi:MAG: sulfatase [Alphaproteobacteria bacterium]|nr:sulfatase [Alphaproteobacteria bacterium]
MLAFALASSLLSACGSDPPPPPPQAVVLISWDTTRADALSAWADIAPPGPAASTPVADALAHDGVRFSWALAHAPTTLASHTSVMSGRDTHGHAVPRNGYPVPDGVPLLAERFSAAGWDTVGVIGASTLSGEMGLSRGFRVYDDHVSTEVRARFEDRADRVTARALAAVDGREPGKPLFLFVHYFDPHSPWDSAPDDLQAGFVDDLSLAIEEPGPLIARRKEGGVIPPDEARRARGMYLAEVAWTDRQTGVLLDGLRARGVLNDAVVVLFADHGEALDEPELHPYGHGLDADLPAIHVPLVIQGTGRHQVPAGQVVERQVRLMDIGTTVLSVAGLAGGPLGAGEDLSVLWTEQLHGRPLPDAPPSFAEATKPDELEQPTRWNNALFDRSVAWDGHFLTFAPWLGQAPTLYRLAAGQPRVTDGARHARLARALRAWDQTAPPFRTVEHSEDTEAALKALGYLEER